MHQVATTLLDTLGLLLIAAGAAAAVAPLIGWACLIPAGAVVIAGSVLAERRARPRPGGER